MSTGTDTSFCRRAASTSMPSRPGKHQVEDHQIVRLGRCKEKAFLTGAGHADGKLIGLQAGAQRPGHLFFVFDDQYAHQKRQLSIRFWVQFGSPGTPCDSSSGLRHCFMVNIQLTLHCNQIHLYRCELGQWVRGLTANRRTPYTESR